MSATLADMRTLWRAIRFSPGAYLSGRGLGQLSVRRSIQIAMLFLVALAGIQLILNQRAMTQAVFLLHRAETSYRQLESYQDLSIDVLEYVFLDGRSAADLAESRRSIELKAVALDRLVASEVELIHDNGGDETNGAERQRLGRIRSLIADVFAVRATDPASAASIYRKRLKPLLRTAVESEQAETADAERAMRAMQQSMLWLGWLGVFFQMAMAFLVFGVAARAVLDPLARLVSDIREFGRGRLGHRVAVLRHDEFGLLAQHINRMARHLDRRDRTLVEINSGLERAVAERTRDLQERNAELQEIDASRRRFFVDVSHELRTPLTAIVGEADVTLRSPGATAAACREALASILANSTYLNRRIDDLMALARSASGRLELELDTLDLNLVAVEAMAEVRSLAKINRVEPLFDPLTKPILVAGDRMRLRQCLTILLDNAIKFSPPGEMVEVRLRESEQSADMIVVDRGRGIASEDLPVVFERFYQTEVGRRMGGTGLGLAIARRIVEAHDGEIAATHAAGGGTMVMITLPLSKSVNA